MPFADYDSFSDCVSQNQDKDNPQAYCGAIQEAAKLDTDTKRHLIRQLYRRQAISDAERDSLLAQLPPPPELEMEEEGDELSADVVIDVVQRILGINKSYIENEEEEEDIGFTFDIDVTKRDEDERLVFGWAMFAENPENPGSGELFIDKQDDFITPEDLENTAYEYVLTSRSGGVMHAVKGTSELVESMVFTPEKLEKMGLPEDAVSAGAWWLGFRVNDDDAWDLVKRSKLLSFSIEGTAMREAMDA